MKVSVIVPVYNVEKYIDKCLDSLVNQTLKDIEIIIVNDGSPDNSEKIIKKYLNKYKNIKYLKKENGGMSSARNLGLKYASGEYIGFADSDDYVSKNMYEKMYNKAKDNDLDMVMCDLNYIYSNKTVQVDCGVKNDKVSIKKLYINNYPSVCNKIFKRELFNNKLEFKNGVWYEDVEFIYRILAYIKSFGVVHEPFIQYVQREGSITHTVSNHIYDYVYNMNGVVDFYKKNKIYDKYKKELEYAYVRYLYATFIKSTLRYKYHDYLESVSFAIKNVHEYFPKYRRNKYFYQSLKGLYLVLFNNILAKIMYLVYKKK